jgi:hypothetical protein
MVKATMLKDSLKLILIFVFIFLQLENSSAQILSIPLRDPEFKLAPASDLEYQNNRISEIEAHQLAQEGIDLSELEPYKSNLYKQTKLDLTQNIQIKNKKIIFHSSLNSPTEFYRASVNIEGENFTISSSLYNHQTMFRAGLLRLLGYDIEIPQYAHTLDLHFSSIEDKNSFLEKLTDSTLLAKSRWIKNLDEDHENNLVLTLKGVLIEPAQLKNVPVYWPIMDESRQKSRRLFRSLLYLYTLTDFNEKINLVEWRTGDIFNNELILSHPYATEFLNTTIDDIKWIHKKIIQLSEDEIHSALKLSHYPKEIEMLLLEKFKARLFHLGQLIQIPSYLKYDENISLKGIFQGKLLEKDYSDYVPSFWEEDPLSPFRFSEMFKFLRNQITYDMISGLLDKAQEKFVPQIDDTLALEKIKSNIQEAIAGGESATLKMWSYPTVGGQVSGRRSIVFGQYLGNNAPIQLVDTFGVQANLGLFSAFTGIPNSVFPTTKIGLSLSRNWTHIRAMPDLSTATEQKVSKLLVPHLMKKLGRVLNDDIECTIEEKAWFKEEIIATVRMWVIYYDKTLEEGKTAALELREKLISENIPSEKILLQAIDKETLCSTEIEDTRNKNLDEFLKEFALDESIMVTDSLNLFADVNVKINFPFLDPLSASLASDNNKATLRSYIIRKTDLGLEITLQTQKNLSTTFSAGLNYYIGIMKNSTKWLDGDMISKVYKIKLVDITDEEKILAIKTLKEILFRNSYSHLKDNYNPIDLNHEAKVKLNTFRFLWFKSEKLKMNHELTVVVPNKAHNLEVDPVVNPDLIWQPPQPDRVDLSLEERTRTLFSTLFIKRNGNNYHAFIDRTINDLIGIVQLGSNDQDPGQSILGKSFKKYYVTESDLTETLPLNATTKIDYIHTGWSLKPKKLQKILDEHEAIFKTAQNNFEIDRTQFYQMSQLRSYDIKTSIILYPEAFTKIETYLYNHSEATAISILRFLYGIEEWDQYCQNAIDFFGEMGPQVYYGEKTYNCLPPMAQTIMHLRSDGLPYDRKEKTLEINELYKALFEEGKKPVILEWLGLENYLGMTKISGFRTEDATGYLNYNSSTMGTLNKDLSTGLFDSIAILLGINAYELKAMIYTPSM